MDAVSTEKVQMAKTDMNVSSLREAQVKIEKLSVSEAKAGCCFSWERSQPRPANWNLYMWRLHMVTEHLPHTQ